MKESILIIMFMSIILAFIIIHSSEVSYQEAFIDKDHYLEGGRCPLHCRVCCFPLFHP